MQRKNQVPNLAKTFVSGLFILLGAVVFNIVAKILGLRTLHDLFLDIRTIGFQEAIASYSIVSMILFFLVYPFVLGYIAFLCFKR